MSRLEEAARAFVDAAMNDPKPFTAPPIGADAMLALARLKAAVDDERDEATKAAERADRREKRLREGDGEPPLTKFARVWGLGSL